MQPVRVSLAELDRCVAELNRGHDELRCVANDVAATSVRRRGGRHPSTDAAREAVGALAAWAGRIATAAAERATDLRRAASTYRDTDEDSARGIASGVRSW